MKMPLKPTLDLKPIIRPTLTAPKILPPIKRRQELPAFAQASVKLDDSKLTGEIDHDAKEELDQVQSGFRARMAQEASRVNNSTSLDYYFVVAFESGAQADHFMSHVGLDREGVFVDGRILADRMGVKLPEASVTYNPGKKASPKLARLIRR